MWLSRYFTYFVVFSCMGWVYETIYCTIKSGKWQNRGFLFGPMCPIYGTGAVAIVALMDVMDLNGAPTFTWWQVFLVSFLGSIVIEYTTSYVLEKLFHAYWWDYSNVPLNIHGRVCFPASCGFGVAGLLVVYVIAPATMNATGWITPILFELFALIFMSLVSIDTTLTVSALTNFEKMVVTLEDQINQHMELLVSNAVTSKQEMDARIEERKQVSKEFTRQMIDHMTGARRSATRRVQGFRYSRIETGRMEAIREQLHNFRK